MGRIYTRKTRALANALILAYLAGVFFVARGESLAWTLAALVLAAPAFLLYGYFIASQHCEQCGESFFHIWGNVSGGPLLSRIAPFYVPFHCPHCGALAR